MSKDKMIDELAVCKSLTEASEIALGNEQYFERDNAIPVIDILGVVQERLELCLEALREELKEQANK